MKKRLGASQVLAMAITMGAASVYAAEQTIETVTVIGSKEEAQKLPGSAGLVDKNQMQQESITDVNQALKSVSGVYIREEDGFGLRPNIGIRAAAQGRSSKVTLMEDGVLIAPAPYSNPAAYYFPTAARLSSIEVLKGAPLLRHGPQTIGGVINLVSTPIPEENSGRAMFMVNDRQSTDLLLNYGGKTNGFGYSLETVQRNYNGFKDIDQSEQDSGFDIEDYVAKLSWENDRNLIQLKLQHSKENSRETYTGLTEADFKKDPNRRYALTDLENMDNQHTGVQLDYAFKFSDNMTATATVYHNEFKRDWFKTGKSKGLINDANDGDAADQAKLNGTTDITGLEYKHNNREYISQGIQANLNWLLGDHDLNVGARVHHDEMDRFQPVELLDQVNGRLVNRRPKAGEIKGSNNREETADAISLWITDDYQVTDSLLLNFSLRMEDVETERKQYKDTNRTIEDTSKNRENSFTEVLAGVGATFNINENWQILGGAHQGITPLGGGAKENQEPETSENYEFGARFKQAGYQVEAIAFHSDFSNKAELCSNATPCSNGDTSGSVVIGGAEVSGLEFNASKTFEAGSINFPIAFSYTFTDAKTVANDGASNTGGLKLKDVPENIASLRAGIELENNWRNYLVINYTDSTCAKNGCNKSNDPLLKTEALTTADLISRYQFEKGPEVFVKVANIFDEQKVVARSPYGARPNMPRTISLGMDYQF